MPRRKRYAAFLLAGGIGFVTDALGLKILTLLGVPSLVSRVASILLALFVTWRINRRITFRATDSGNLKEFGKYLSVGASTSILNYAVFALLVAGWNMPEFPALVIASITAMIFSYMGYDRFVFSRSREKE